MATAITTEDLFRAFDDAIAISQEWDSDSLEEKLRAFGLEVEDVREVLTERWGTYRALFNPDRPEDNFAQAMLEGLLAGTKLRPSCGRES